jgi:O-antigen/teichoic acid export membrane protein
MALSRNPGRLLRRIVTEVAITLIADAAVLACFFIFYRILLDYYGAENLGVYTLMRRYAAILLPLLLLGLSDGLGRFIAVSATSATRTRLMVMGALGTIAANSIAAVSFNVDPAASAKWLFGDESFREAVMPFSVLVAGMAMHAFVYACLRGHLRVVALNVLQLVNLGLLPIAALLVFEQAGFSKMIVIIGIANFLIALLFLTPLVRWPGPLRESDGDKPNVGALYTFSVSRIPAAMIGAALASLAPIIAKDHISMTEVGYLSLSLALLLALSGAVSPLGTVLLPHVSALVRRNDTRAVGERLHLLIGAVVQVYLFATFQFLAFGEFLIRFWMGEGFLPAVRVTAIVLASLPFFGFYYATRSMLDGISTRPINSINTIISVLVLLAIIFAGLRWQAGWNLTEMFAVACSVATAVLGTLTYLALRAIFPQDRGQDCRHALWGLTLSSGLFLLSFTAQPVVTSSLLALATYELCIFGLYLWALHLLQFEWPRIIFGRAPS